jgi:gamma-glutamylcyclotransferase (GGCT)/AIG2-like uncharacterized protein YtfP
MEWISTVANVLAVTATLIGFGLAFYFYRKEHGRHSAGMLLDAYSRFYDSSEKRGIRAALESSGQGTAERKRLEEVVRKAIADERLDTENEATLTHQLDEYLNFFQFMGWLLEHKDLKEEDVRGMFAYYISDLCSAHNAWLLPYIHKFSFTGLERLLRSARDWPQGEPNVLFVYGTLRPQIAHESERTLLRGSRAIGKGRFWGKLYDLGNYPGLVESWDHRDVVHGELFEISQSQLLELDRHEGCNSEDGHEYVRMACQVKGPGNDWVNAYVYIYNKDPNGLPLIAGGDYVAHRKSQR